MYVFVWQRIERASDNYHTEGGVVVFAKTLTRAREIINEQPGSHIVQDEYPDDVRAVDGGDEAVYIMPDAGCC